MSYRLLDTLPVRTGGSDNYRVIRERLNNMQPFQGNSMTAFYDENGTYVVVSYSTVIATKAEDGTVEIQKNLWGPTTGRHINMCKAAL